MAIESSVLRDSRCCYILAALKLRGNDALSLHLPSLGIFAWIGLEVPFPDRVKMIRGAGFAVTSVWWDEDNETRRRLRHLCPELVRHAGLILDNIHVPYRGCNELWSPVADERRSAVARHVTWLEHCGRPNIPAMVMHATTGADLPTDVAHGVDSFRRIVDVAEGLGVRVALENSRSAAHLYALFRAIDSPFLALCYDSAHDWLCSPTPLQLLNMLGGRLKATHFSDTDGVRDQHRLPGEGVIDFDAIGRAHNWAAYTGSLMLEVIAADKSEPPESYLARAFASAEWLRGQLLGVKSTADD